MDEGVVTATDQLTTQLMGFPLPWSLDMADKPSRASSHGGCCGKATTAVEGLHGSNNEPAVPIAPATTGGCPLPDYRTARLCSSAPVLAPRSPLQGLTGVSGGGGSSSGGSGGGGGRGDDGGRSSVDSDADGSARRRRSPSGWSPLSAPTPASTSAARLDGGKGGGAGSGEWVGVCDAVGRLSTGPTGGGALVHSTTLPATPLAHTRGGGPGRRRPVVWAGDVGDSAFGSALTDSSADGPGRGRRGVRQRGPPPAAAARVRRPQPAVSSAPASFDMGKVLRWAPASDDEDDSGEEELDADPEEAAAIAAAAVGAPLLPAATATATAGAPAAAQGAVAPTAAAGAPTTVPPSPTETALRVTIAGLHAENARLAAALTTARQVAAAAPAVAAATTPAALVGVAAATVPPPPCALCERRRWRRRAVSRRGGGGGGGGGGGRPAGVASAAPPTQR